MSRLKDAEPIMVAIPSSLDLPVSSVFRVSMMFKKISGALDPMLIKIKLAMVGFQTGVMTLVFTPSYSMYWTLLEEVIFSIPLLTIG